VDGIRIRERRLEVPDPLELPGVLCAIVPLVRGEGLASLGRGVVDDLVALTRGHAVRRLRHATAGRLPRLAAVARALDDLSEPSARLRRVQPVRIRGRSLHVIDLPPREMRAAHVPLLALAVPRQDERTLAGTHQHSYSAHDRLLPWTCSANDGRQIYPFPGARNTSSRISHSPCHPGQCCWCRRRKIRADSMASSRELASSTAYPPTTSLASVNGPSVTVSLPPARRTRALAELGASPPVSTTEPSRIESSTSLAMASSSAWGGA